MRRQHRFGKLVYRMSSRGLERLAYFRSLAAQKLNRPLSDNSGQGETLGNGMLRPCPTKVSH